MSRTTIIGFDMDIAHEPPAKRLKTQVVGSDISVELDADPVDEVWNESEAVSVEAQIEIPLPEVTLLNEQDRPEPILGSIPYIKVPELCNPPSQYDGWEPPCTLLPEKEALDSILKLWQKGDPDDDEVGPDILLSHFSIYATQNNMREYDWKTDIDSLEFVPLHHLKTKVRRNVLLFDGIVSYGSFQAYVKGAPFEVLSIGGYDASNHAVSNVWLQSFLAGRQHFWYVLGDPSQEYRNYHNAFLWNANFCKYFVDFLLDFPDARVQHFQRRFCESLTKKHCTSRDFSRWLEAYGKSDFRVPLTSYVEFLWKEASDVEPKLRKHPIWKEIDPKQLKAIPQQIISSKKTTVTPFVYNCFKDLYFAPVLEPCPWTTPSVISKRQSRLRNLHFPTHELISADAPADAQKAPKSVAAGDVVAICRDTQSAWKDMSKMWFVYVHKINQHKTGNHVLEIVWMYSPEHTTCGNMHYPYKNEIFMSNHCTCGETNIRLSDVCYKVPVVWKPVEIPRSKYFVRQKYCTETNSFTTFQSSDLICTQHNHYSDVEELVKKYKVGDTVLVERKTSNGTILEPCVIHEFIHEENNIKVRELFRRARDFNDPVRPNELVWSDYALNISARSVNRRCHIRFYSREDVLNGRVPAPYDRDGQADCWYITSRVRPDSKKLEELNGRRPGRMNQGFDPTTPNAQPSLPALSLFSGGGNFDRGLEEGGVLETKWAVEWNKTALHTHRACCSKPNELRAYLGSVDDHLKAAIHGCVSKLVPDIGAVCVICGGSPGQGFSVLQPDTASAPSLTNASKAASVASYVDHYRPAYAILKNVTSMTRLVGPKKDQSVFSQMLCAFVAMGYQVQQFNLDAWSFGSPQSRSRLFISIAAPGLVPLTHPNLTHSHPRIEMKLRSLGKAINGERFGLRHTDSTPFKFVSAQESTCDLPDIGHGHIQTCIKFPAHRVGLTTKPLYRTVIRSIPIKATLPDTMKKTSLVAAFYAGELSGPVLEYFTSQNPARRQPSSHQWARIDPDGLFPPITTKLAPMDFKAGYGIHWEQHRFLTLMEARRAQGFPDDEPLIGTLANQWKIVGNSVARQVSLALGMQIREAWLSNSQDAVDLVLKPIEVEEGSETATIEEDGDDTTPHRTRDSSPETSSIGPSNHVVGASVPCDDFHTNGLERTPTPATTPSRSVTLGDFGNVDSIEQDDPGELLSQQGIGVRIMQSGCHADRDGHALLTATAGTMPTPDRVDNWVNVSCRSVDDMIGRLEM